MNILHFHFRQQFYFSQRHALVHYGMVPGIAKVLIISLFWIVPLLFYFSCFYSIAFAKQSLGMSIFFMAIMCHPIITIPFAVCTKWFCKVTKEKLGRKLSFTMTLYLCFIFTSQFYLFSEWVDFRTKVINEKCEVNEMNITREKCEEGFVTRHEFGSKLYDQCDCKADECVNLIVTENKDNIEEALNFLPNSGKQGNHMYTNTLK